MQAPQVSLKERIAALQQRDARSASPSATSSSSAGAPAPNALRDKIAKFEKEGAVPTPRGSFGMGAPPLAENGQLKRRGELYGNRIPAPVAARIPSNPLPKTEPKETDRSKFRSFSVSPPPPLEGNPAAGKFGTKPRSPSFATALEIARKGEAVVDLPPPSRPVSPVSPSPLLRRRFSSFTSEDSSPFSLSADTTLVDSIAVHTTGDSYFDGKPVQYLPSLVREEEDEEGEDEIEEGPIELEQEVEATTPRVESTPLPSPSPHSPQPAIHVTNKDGDLGLGDFSSQPSDDEGPAREQVILARESESPEGSLVTDGSEPEIPPVPSMPLEDVIQTSDPELNNLAEPPVIAEKQTEIVAESEQDSLLLEPEVTLTGQEPASKRPTSEPAVETQAVEGPVVAPTSAVEPFQVEPTPSPEDATTPTPEDRVSTPKALSIPPPAPPAITIIVDDADECTPSTLEPAQPSPQLLNPDPDDSDSDSAISRPTSLLSDDDDDLFTMPMSIDTKSTRYRFSSDKQMPDSPFVIAPSMPFPGNGHATPVKARPASMAVMETPRSANQPSQSHSFAHQQQLQERPSPVESDFGTVVSIHRPTQSVSHLPVEESESEPVTPLQDKFLPGTKSFSAVVHGRVRDRSRNTTITAKTPLTPQMKRVRNSAAEPPPSPGAGELAALLWEAAMLESRLENGDGDVVVSEEKPNPPHVPAVVEQVTVPVMPTGVGKRHKRTFRIPNTLTRTKSGSSTTTDDESHRRASGSGNRPGRESDDEVPPMPARPMTTYEQSTRSSSDQYARRPETLQPMPEDGVPPTPPPKSPNASKYLGSFRRLASRHSVSSSSDDSMPVVTPPEHSLEFGVMDAGGKEGGSVAWPRLSPSPSPKKAATVGRAASFADRIWNRGRAKSGVSVADDDNSDRVSVSSFKLRLNRKPSTPPVPTAGSGVIVPPVRSHSLHIRSDSKYTVPGNDTMPKLDFLKPSTSTGEDFMQSVAKARPTSWMSTVDQSPDQSLDLDAFPSPPKARPSLDLDSQFRQPARSGTKGVAPPSSYASSIGGNAAGYSSGASLSRTSTSETHRQHLVEMNLL